MTGDAARYLAAAEKVVATMDEISRTRALTEPESRALEAAINRVNYWKSIIEGEAK